MGNTKTNSESREQSAQSAAQIQSPRIEKDTDALPSALTFFLQSHQRRAAVEALKKISPDRTIAMMKVLGLNTQA